MQCDDCLRQPRPWRAGRAALVYKDKARALVLALKHGGRLEIARLAAGWLHNSAHDLLQPDMIVAPVPLHWSRLFGRTFNQSAALVRAFADVAGVQHCPDLLVRDKRTHSLDRRTVEDRFGILENAMSVHPRRRDLIRGRPVLIVDDVMTSGATLAAATEACHHADSGDVFVLTLARVAKDA